MLKKRENNGLQSKLQELQVKEQVEEKDHVKAGGTRLKRI
jgi:hypothetical protein